MKKWAKYEKTRRYWSYCKRKIVECLRFHFNVPQKIMSRVQHYQNQICHPDIKFHISIINANPPQNMIAGSVSLIP